MIECHNVSVSYGEIIALNGVSLSIPNRKMVSIIGANGAGKTTLLRAISGLERIRHGRVLFDGEDITGHHTPQIARAGIAHVTAERAIFPNLTVVNQLKLGAYRLGRRHSQSQEAERDLEWVTSLFPILRERASQEGRTLSGGEQQMLAIGRALMSRPRLLLLDEPSLGLAPMVVTEVLHALNRLNQERGVTILLVEQNAHLALDFASYAFVLDRGHLAKQGPTDELREDQSIAEIYLGVSA